VTKSQRYLVLEFGVNLNQECSQVCSGAATRGNGVPTPFLRFVHLKCVWSYCLFLEAFPHVFC